MAITQKTVVINVKANTKGIKDLQKEVDKLEKENKQMAKSFKDANAKMQQQTKKTKDNIGGMGKAVQNLGGIIAGAFALDSLRRFGQAILDTRAEFQKLEAVLTNTLGSNSKAQVALAQIQKFASKTPFAVVELTQAFVKLANQGFKPTTEELRKLGDLASSTGKQFDQLAEAIIDAQTGEFERLKEFGIRASKQGDQVQFTFKGVKKQVDFTNDAIRGYILSLGDLEGVSGSMEAISKTLGGQISNLGDSWDSLLNKLGQQTEGAFSNAIGFLGDFTNAIGWLVDGEKGLEKQSRLTFGAEQKALAEEYFQAQVEGGKDEQAVKMELYKTNNELFEQKKSAMEQAEKELKETSSFNSKRRFLIESVIAQYKGEIDALRDTSKHIAQLKAEIGEPEGDGLTNTVAQLKKEIKAITGSLDGMVIGSDDLINALELLKVKQMELKNAMNPVSREADVQMEKMESLTATHVKQTKEIGKSIDDVNDRTLEQAYKTLWGIEIDNKSPAELLMEAHEEWKQQQKLIRDSVLDATESVADAGFEIYKNRLDAEFEYEKSINQSKLQAGKISQSEFEYEQEKLFREQAERTKKLAIFEINVAGAIASARVWAGEGDFYTKLILQGVVLAETFAQLAVVNSQPLPQFEHGGLIGGQLHRNGGTVIEAEKGEYMINRHSTAKHGKLIKEINEGDPMEFITKKYVYPALEKQRLDLAKNNSLADNIAQSIKQHNALDDRNIVGWLGRIDKTSKRNTDTLVGALSNNRKDVRNV